VDEAAWAALCPPVRERYLAEGGQPGPGQSAARVQARERGRALMLGALRQVSRFRLRRRGPPGPLPPNARILAVQPDNLGGMLLTTPALRLLKAGLPECELTVMAGPWAADVAAHCPVVDRVEVCPFPGFSPGGGPPRGASPGGTLGPWRLLLEQAAGLSGEGFHLALICHPGFYWGAALAAVAGVPQRVGYDSPDGAPFLSHTLPLPRRPVGAPARAAPGPHVADLGLALAREALSIAGAEAPGAAGLRPLYEPAPAERAEAARHWRAHSLDQERAVIAIHPAPGAPAKRWTAQRFAIVGDHFAGRYGARIVLTGGPGDVDEARAVARHCHVPPVLLAGQTSFGALGALLERCRFVVGTDNGALHLATARGVPTVRLFGPVDPAAWGGWTGPPGPSDASGATGSYESLAPPTLSLGATLPCAPCHRLDLPPWEAVSGAGEGAYPCMRDLTAEGVIAAAERVWALTEGMAAARGR
jgi:ADP-heptose:LPS heptosyltransferase